VAVGRGLLAALAIAAVVVPSNGVGFAADTVLGRRQFYVTAT
jgi:hypothetical protein